MTGVAPGGLARVGQRRAHGRLDVDAVHGPGAGDRDAVAPGELDRALGPEVHAHGRTERWWREQRHLGRPVDELTDRAARVAAVGAPGRAVEAGVEHERVEGEEVGHREGGRRARPGYSRQTAPRCAPTMSSGPPPTSPRPQRGWSASTAWWPRGAGRTTAWAPTTASCRSAAGTSSCSPSATRRRRPARPWGAPSPRGSSGSARASWRGPWPWTTSRRSPTG